MTAGLAACVMTPAIAQDLPDAVVKAAQKEGELTYYSAVDEGQTKMLVEMFSKKYGIKGTYLRLVSGQLVQRFITENDNNSNIADVFLDSGPLSFRLHPQYFVPLDAELLPNLAKWSKQWIDERSVTVLTSPMVVTYNTDMVTAAEVPKTWRETADPKWKGKILLTDPRTSETYLGWLAKMESAVGADFVKALAAQNFTVIASGASGVQMIAAGAFPLNFPTYASFGTQLKAKQAPIESLVMKGPTIVSQSSMGIPSHAKHPNVARLFANFLMSDEAISAVCKAYPASTPRDPDGKLGCVALTDPQLVDYVVDEKRKLSLIQMIGLASR